jgi:hypothetical protein
MQRSAILSCTFLADTTNIDLEVIFSPSFFIFQQLFLLCTCIVSDVFVSVNRFLTEIFVAFSSKYDILILKVGD